MISGEVAETADRIGRAEQTRIVQGAIEAVGLPEEFVKSSSKPRFR